MDLNRLVAQVAELLPSLLGPEIDLVLAPDGCCVRADPAQIEQVILSLVMNARDAMPEGGELTVETSAVVLDDAAARRLALAQTGPQVKIAVSDTGCGMDAETLAHLFEPLFTTKEKEKGSGLGLASVYGTIEQSGGAIRVESELGRGSTIEMYLPRVEQPAEIVEPPRVPARSLQDTETILIVEDDDSVRKLTREFLKLPATPCSRRATPPTPSASPSVTPDPSTCCSPTWSCSSAMAASSLARSPHGGRT